MIFAIGLVLLYSQTDSKRNNSELIKSNNDNVLVPSTTLPVISNIHCKFYSYYLQNSIDFMSIIGTNFPFSHICQKRAYFPKIFSMWWFIHDYPGISCPHDRPIKWHEMRIVKENCGHFNKNIHLFLCLMRIWLGVEIFSLDCIQLLTRFSIE